jgi:hypothetical protein
MAKNLHGASLANDLSRLIKSNYRAVSPIKKLKPNPKLSRAFMAGLVEAAMKYGICEPLYKGRALKAIFLMTKVQLVPGLPLHWGLVETDRSREAERWLITKLKEHSGFFADSSMLEFPAYLRASLPKLEKAGFFVDSVKTFGEVRASHRRLTQVSKSFSDPASLGLSIERLRRVDDLRQITRIEEREFRRNPQFGWFVPSKNWLKHSFRTRKQCLNSPDACLYMVKKGKKVLGYFGCTPMLTTFRGKFAGTDFVFDKSIQGKGLSYVGYRMLLEFMLEDKIDFFGGNTAQAPTMKLSKLMGRKPVNFILRFGKGHFPRSHFRF